VLTIGHPSTKVNSDNLYHIEFRYDTILMIKLAAAKIKSSPQFGDVP